MNYKIGMISLGCPKNQVDAEHMLAQPGVILGGVGPGAGSGGASKAGISLINHRFPLHRSGGSRPLQPTAFKQLQLIGRAPVSMLYIAYVTC